MATVDMPAGTLRVYEANQNFVMQCKAPGHDACFLTRKRRARPGGDGTRGGRPLGLMMAWIDAAGDYESSRSHVDVGRCALFDLPTRSAARRAFMETYGAAAVTMAAYERDRVPGEPEEPEVAL